MQSARQQRSTAQRATVLQALKEGGGHPTAEELYERTKRTHPHVSLATVYRNLRLFERMGIVQQIDLGGRAARFDVRVDPHDHIECTKCGRVDDLSLDAPIELEALAAEKTGYLVSGRRIQFIGVCPDCLGKAER